MKRKISLLCALMLAPTLALAQPKTPGEWFREGENQYNLGNFAEAVKAFKEGFSLEPVEGKKAVYLYNVAQSYRQMKDCSNAQFFYKRFLALKDNDTSRPLEPQVRKDVEDRIKELEACAREQEAIAKRPPDAQIKPEETKPDPNAKVAVVTPEGPEEDPEDGVTKTYEGQPRLVSARIAIGGTKMGVGSLSVPISPTFAITGGYPIPLNEKMMADVGLTIGYARVKWDAMETTGQTGAASFTAVLANGGVTYGVAPKMAVRGDLGLGVLFVGNVSDSPFTEGASTDGGALTLFHVRAAAAFDYEIQPNLVATVPLAFGFSPKKDGLAGNVVSFDFMVGIGYRM
jgi:tetratricopeptide (TPR) repeat protein